MLSQRGCTWVAAFLLLGLLTADVGVAAQEDDDGVTVEVDHQEEDLSEYRSPEVDQKDVYFSEHFDNENIFKIKWVKSESKKLGVDEDIAKYDGKWKIQAPTRKILKDDLGLVLTTEAKHAAISALLKKPFAFKDKPLIVQYEVTMQEGQNCGGAYLKLLSQGSSNNDLKKFYDQTPYTIMFGPDKCGNDNKLHFIFRHRNPKNGTIEEKHSKKATQRLDDIYKDKQPHLYTLIVRPDNTFVINVDNKEVNSGSLLEDFTPPVNPPEEIDDPNDRKPEDWDEREKIVDPAAVKPEDWDEDAPAQIVDSSASKPDTWLESEPEMISDPEAAKPEDWDNEMDGEWEAPLIDNPVCANAAGCGVWKPPMIPNPNYKGVWRAPLIPNPNYKGKWTPRRIRNPHYFRDEQPFKMTPIYAVGFELWSMSPSLLFDNIIITDDPEIAAQWAAQSFALKQDRLSKDAVSLWGRAMKAINYRPGWWAVYFVYCSIPVSLYIWFLLRKVNEDSLVTWLVRVTNDNPWLWAVYIVVVFTIVGFLAYLCCTGSSKDSLAEDEDRKKTDAVTEDDPHGSGGEGDEGEGDGDGEGEAEAEGESEKEEAPSGKTKLEEPQPESTQASADSDAAGDGHRKRKPRKE